jgi:competence protein ComEC
MRRLAPPHLLLTAYCAGLCLAILWRPAACVLVAWLVAAVLATLAGARGECGALRRDATSAGADGEPSPNTHRSSARLALPIALGALLLAVGVISGSARLASIAESQLSGRVGERVALRATLVDLPTQDDDTLNLAVRVTAVDGTAVDEPSHLSLRLEDEDELAVDHCGPLTEGALLALDHVQIKALPEPPDDGGFDYGRYLERRGEHVVLAAALDDLRLVGRRGGVQGVVDRLRLASRAHLRTGLHGPVAEVLQGMVLGDDEGVPEQIVDDFRRSGLLHIMAVSGENVVLLCAMWSFALMLFGVPRLTRTLALLPIVATYVLLTGASPSIVRAGIAGIAGLVAILVSRPTDGWLVWLVPGAWLLTVNPNNLFDVSFQLSFAAVAGLLLLSRPLTRALRFLPAAIAEQAGVTTAASIATTPVSMLTFGSTSVVAVAANLAGGFVLGPIMFLGMLSLLAGFVASWLSLPLNLLAGLFIGFLLEVSRFFGRLSFAVYEWQGLTLGLLLATAVVTELVALRVLAGKERVSLGVYVTSASHRARIVLVTAALVGAALLLAPVAPAAPSAPTLRFLAVGEGAAALLQVPDGPTILIDAGPDPLGMRLKRLGVERIDLVVLSHGHADHVGGLPDVIARLDVRAALMPSPQRPSPSLAALAADLSAAGVQVSTCVSPLDLAGDGWRLRVLPTRPLPGETGNQSENDAALVALVEVGGQLLLVPGDAEGQVLVDLELPPCDVVELPHHGSRGGVDEAFLEDLDPSLAVISVGPNRFGHPTPEMLALLSACRIPCLRTDLVGDIVVSARDGALSVTTAGP